ncbi:MAG: hypothetical protein AAF914_01245 [Pseudomonadota bacterium]
MPRPFMKCLSLCAAILGVLPAPSVAQDDDLIWGLNRYAEPEPGDAGVAAFYGVPRSDFALVILSCDLSGGAPSVSAQFEAPTGAFANGDRARATFRTPGRPPVGVAGEIIGIGREIGIIGLSARLPLNASLWALILSDGPVSYAIDGASMPLTLSGDPSAVSDFLVLCAGRGRPACADLGALASVETGIEQDIVVTNSTIGERRVVWIDPEGTEREVGVLQPNETATLGSDRGHVWMFADARGRCVEVRGGAAARAPIQLFAPDPPG